MIKREDLAKNSAFRCEKAVGAICGLAIGDSLGDAARTQENRANYGFITDFSGGAVWSTDDTEFALLTAQTMIRCGGELTQEAVTAAWLENVAVQDEFKRGGDSEVEAANNLRRGLRPPQSGMFNTYHLSDGAAMRIAPIGVAAAGDPKAAARMAEIDASISHSMDGIWGAQAVAAAVSVAMVDGTIDEILAAAMDCVPADSWLYANLTAAFEIVEAANFDVAAAWMKLHDRLRTTKWATTAEAIPSAFACLRLAGADFRKGVTLAANFGRDADTIGAVCGAILGAKYGVSAIPASWVEKTRYPSGTCLQFTKGIDLIEIGERLAELIR